MTAPRLKDFNYKGYFAYSITIRYVYRIGMIPKSDSINYFIQVLKELSVKYSFDVYCYTFMSDHCHFFVVGKTDNSNLVKLINMFKQKTGFWYKNKYKVKLWQNGYYDHVIRKEEGIDNVVRYILNNPIRKGFVIDYREYPYSGSFIFELDLI